MITESNSKIIALGAYLPQKKLTNQDLAGMVDTNDEWIVRRTGVRERRISEKNEFASNLAIKAVENLIEKNNVRVDDVDMIIVTTFTPDHLTPSVAALVQGYFGMEAAGTMDINAACAGYVYGMSTADALVSTGYCKKALVIAAEALSKIVDYTDRNTCILFGDGAAATLIERTGEKGGFISSYFTSDGKLAENVACTNLSESINGRVMDKKRLFEQEGKLLYEYVVKNIPAGVNILLQNANMTLEDIEWFVPHSANLRMIEAVCKKLGFPVEKTLISNEFYGNTSSATIPLAIWMALQESKIKPGDKMLLYGFGGGLTHGGIIVKWQ